MKGIIILCLCLIVTLYNQTIARRDAETRLRDVELRLIIANRKLADYSYDDWRADTDR